MDRRRVKGFDFTSAMRRLCEDIVNRVPIFSHIQMEKVAVSFVQARSESVYGTYARLTPLRFAGGATTTVKNGQKWTIQRVIVDNQEMLYILSFYLPRFLNLPFREKMITVFHELYHISPDFDGDFRRFEGRYKIHSHSAKEFDRHLEQYVDLFLKTTPDESLYEFLRFDFDQIYRKWGGIYGIKIPIPKLIPVGEVIFKV